MSLKNKAKNKLNFEKLLFLGVEFLGAIVFSVISVFFYKYGDAIFGGFLLPLIIKIFCLYITMDLWETLYKNLKPKENNNEQKCEVIEPETYDEDIVMPHAPDFDE